MFHCGEIKLRDNNLFHCQGEEGFGRLCHAEFISGSLAERIAKSPQEEGVCRSEQSEILRSSSTALFQANGISLRMTNAFDNSNKSRHPEQSEGSLSGGVRINSSPQSFLLGEEKVGGFCHPELVSGFLTERTGQFTSPREEGVWERVLSFTKIKTLKHTMQKCAFTLAEVLITLGIIGVVAAITLPTLITNYQKHVVETKLAKFNSTMNQAMRLSMVDNGDPDSWLERNHNYTYPETVEFMNTYFLPYMKYIKTEPSSSQNGIRVTLLDGSYFSFSVTQDGGDIGYFINGKREINPRNYFQYQFTKKKDIGTNDVNSASYIEPYIFRWNGSVNHLKNGNTWACKKGCTNCGYCTKLIQLNGWKIPKDYPW